jgi:hypothetical protein
LSPVPSCIIRAVTAAVSKPCSTPLTARTGTSAGKVVKLPAVEQPQPSAL